MQNLGSHPPGSLDSFWWTRPITSISENSAVILRESCSYALEAIRNLYQQLHRDSWGNMSYPQNRTMILYFYFSPIPRGGSNFAPDVS